MRVSNRIRVYSCSGWQDLLESQKEIESKLLSYLASEENFRRSANLIWSVQQHSPNVPLGVVGARRDSREMEVEDASR